MSFSSIKGSKRGWLAAAVFLVVALAAVGGWVWSEPRKEDVEEIVFDELDFYDHATNLKNFHLRLAPERVRRFHASYFFRSSGNGTPAGYTGSRYAEILVPKETGSLIYLPNDLSLEGAKALSLWVYRAAEGAKAFVRIYGTATSVAEIIEGESPYFPTQTAAGWRKITIPLQGLTFAPRELPVGEPVYEDLAHFDVVKNKVFALELGLKDVKKDGTLFADRFILERRAGARRVLEGSTSPAVADLKVEINSPTAHYETFTNSRGRFSLELPPGVSRYEVLTTYKDMRFVPRQGRYFEISTYVPPVTFDLDEKVAGYAIPGPAMDKLPARPTTSSEELSEHYLPGRMFFHQSPGEFFVEKSSNNFGYLDKDRRYENPDRAFRVLVMGSCYVEGLQITSQEHFAAQAEAISHFKGGRPTEVISLGNNLMILTHWWPVLLNHALKFKPDLIVLTFLMPDELRELLLEEDSRNYGYDDKHPRNYFFRINPKMKKLVHIKHDPDWRLYAKEKVKTDFEWNEQAQLVDKTQYPPQMKKAIDVLVESLKLFRDRTKASGSSLTFAFASYIGGIQQTEGDWKTKKYSPNAVPLLIEDIAKRSSLPYVDLTDVMRAEMKAMKGKNTIGFATDGHWSAAGHRFFAESLVAYTNLFSGSEKASLESSGKKRSARLEAKTSDREAEARPNR